MLVLVDPLLDLRALKVARPRNVWIAVVGGVGEHEIDVMCTTGDEDGEHGAAQVAQHTTPMPRIEQPIREDNVGRRGNVLATQGNACPLRPRCDSPFVHAALRATAGSAKNYKGLGLLAPASIKRTVSRSSVTGSSDSL